MQENYNAEMRIVFG